MNDNVPQQQLLCDYSPEERERVRRLLTRFFQAFDPQKISSNSGGEEDIVQKTLLLPIKETTVLAKLCDKYGVKFSSAQQMEEICDAMASKTSAHKKKCSKQQQHWDDREVPVCDYFGANRHRLRARLMLFYKKFHPPGLEKVDSVLQMHETEQAIFQTLVARYNVNREVEQALWAEHPGVLMFFDDDDNDNHDHGEYCTAGGPVHLYTEEDVERLRRRVTNFYKTHDPSVFKTDAEKVERVLMMHNSEDEIFSRLHKKYQVDPQDEENAAVADGCFAGMAEDACKLISFGIPVVCYEPEAKLRLRRRLENFYALHDDIDDNDDTDDEDDDDDQHKEEQHREKIAQLLEANESEAAIFHKLCVKHKVDPDDERLDARIARSLPVSCFSPAETDRLRRRLKLFYEKHNPASLQKVENVLIMTDTEEKIFETLYEKYAAGDGVVEERDARASECFPDYDVLAEKIDLDIASASSSKKKRGRGVVGKHYFASVVAQSYHVCLYPPSERARLRRRLQLFYEANNAPADKLSNVTQVLEMENSETEIFATLYKKYGVDAADEQAMARQAGVLSVEDEF